MLFYCTVEMIMMMIIMTMSRHYKSDIITLVSYLRLTYLVQLNCYFEVV